MNPLNHSASSDKFDAIKDEDKIILWIAKPPFHYYFLTRFRKALLAAITIPLMYHFLFTFYEVKESTKKFIVHILLFTLFQYIYITINDSLLFSKSRYIYSNKYVNSKHKNLI